MVIGHQQPGRAGHQIHRRDTSLDTGRATQPRTQDQEKMTADHGLHLQNDVKETLHA